MTFEEEMEAVRSALWNERSTLTEDGLLSVWAAIGGPGYRARNKTPNKAATWTSPKFGWRRVRR